MSIRTDCGATVNNGDRVYNYYDMVPGTIVSEPKEDGWFYFQADDSRAKTVLNGQRICTIDFAKRRGFRGV